MDAIDFFLSAYLVFVGFMLGSFINLAADRLPRGESLIRPRSHCRACGRRLDAVDLLPVLGYLIRGGRCASCRTEIGISSPLIEAAAGGAMAVAVISAGPWPGAIAGLAVVGIIGIAAVGRGFSQKLETELPARP